MNNKEFIADLSARTKYSAKEVTSLIAAVVSVMTSELTEEKSIAISGFGTFEVRKKLERVLVNPTTKQRMLVPPKMVVNFRPTSSVKEKMRNR